ncbi:MAG: hypothetical protein MUF34_17095 [Polyangiaceae bacterium]|nr:hypothetical protein [Polyangiaceae bacterium]
MVRSASVRALFLVTLGCGLAACGDDDGDRDNDGSETLGAAGARTAGSGGSSAGVGGAAGGSTSAGTSGAAGGPAGGSNGGSGGGGSGGGGGNGSGAQGGAGGASGAAPSRYVTGVVSFTPGPGAGFGQDRMPDVVCGPPRGGGEAQGSLDVVSLGVGGEIVVEFAASAAIDGPGVDFLVFENVFAIAGGGVFFRELAEVSVSDDGIEWYAFPCDASAPDQGACAGRNVVYANPETGVSALDPAVAGGDPFDLASIGRPSARFVRLRDRSASPPQGTSSGFDLDAVALINASAP